MKGYEIAFLWESRQNKKMNFFRKIFQHRSKATPATRVVLYTRKGCHLCDVAKETLRQHGCVPQEVDIDEDADLLARFDRCVPVVEIDGKVRFRGRVEKRLLRRLL